jgi:hypothetical protein
MQTMNDVMTTIYVRAAEGSTDVKAVTRAGSMTMAQLLDNVAGVSSVIECDVDGHPLSRAVAASAPSDVLHSGRHYVVKRDIGSSQSAVTFASTVTVREFDVASSRAHSTATEDAPAAPQPAPAAAGLLPATVTYESGGESKVAAWDRVEAAMGRDHAAERTELNAAAAIHHAEQLLAAH